MKRWKAKQAVTRQEMKPLHILYLHQYFVPPDGSGGTRSYEMARRFVRAGHRVTLITSSALFPKRYEFPARSVGIVMDGIELRVIRVPYANQMGYGRRLLAFVQFAFFAALEAIHAERPDVVFASSTPLTIAIPGVVAKLWHRRPMVFEVRDLWPEVPIALGVLRNPVVRALARLLERLAYRASERIVALSPAMKAGVLRAGIPDSVVAVIPNSCDRELFERPKPGGFELPFDHSTGPLVTYAGTLGKVNGAEYLAEIAAETASRAPGVRFLVVGDGAMRRTVEGRARSAGVLGHNFWLLPPIPKDAMPALLSRTTVAVSLVIDVPELWNNSANKFFDALAAGVPIMINHEGWQADILRESGAGLVVPPADARAAAAALVEFLGDEARLSRAATAARTLARVRFDRDVLAAQLLAVLVEAASGVGATPSRA
jgi:glycosyltransferase involved in cell wall biosynthesis